MNTPLIFIWVFLAFIAMAFWEAYIEGKDAWARRQVGWTLRITKNFTITAYHFYMNIMFLFLLTLPLVIFGWDARLFGILLSAGMLGGTLEDFCWFIINPYYGVKKFNPKKVKWYPWYRIGRFAVPKMYVANILIAAASWYFLWK